MSPPRVLFVCTRGDGRDGIFPIGLIQAANTLRCPRRGVLTVELDPGALSGVAVVVLHLHWDFNHLYFDELVRYVRAAEPDARIVVGGYLATVHAPYLTAAHGVDFCIAGDYEQPFPRLVEAILEGRDDAWIRANVPNVHSRAGAPLRSYRVSPGELRDLDGLTIDWFPALQRYTRFQDALNLLGLAKWTEEQYFPALILKGAFAEHCAYCTLSTQRFDMPCGPELFTYIGEEAFVEFLDACRGWRGVNVFGDFAALDLPRILRLLEGRHYGFEISIGDLFREIEPAQLERLASHFAKVWLGFRLLPRPCYLGRAAITPEMIDTPYARRLWELTRTNDRLSVGFWVNGGNLEPGADFAPYSDRFLFMDGWLRFPTERPGGRNFAALLERSRGFKLVHETGRRIAVRCERRSASPRALMVERDPLTQGAAWPDGLPQAELDAIGRFAYTQRIEPGSHDFVVFDEKAYIDPPVTIARRFSVLVPDAVDAHAVELTLVENVFRVVVRDGRGEPLVDEILPFTAGEVSRHVGPAVVDELRRALARAPAVTSL